jgi:hypothetical protein
MKKPNICLYRGAWVCGNVTKVSRVQFLTEISSFKPFRNKIGMGSTPLTAWENWAQLNGINRASNR